MFHAAASLPRLHPHLLFCRPDALWRHILIAQFI
jgi:hypothetical protein